MRTWTITVEAAVGGAIVTASQQFKGGAIVTASQQFEDGDIGTTRRLIVPGDTATFLFNRRARKALIALVKEAFPPEEKPATVVADPVAP
jgi:hypothetical protein